MWVERGEADVVPPVAAYEDMTVPEAVAAVRFLWSAFLWGWPWALAHRLYSWAAADFAISIVVALVGLVAIDVNTWPTTAFVFLMILGGWVGFRVALAHRAAPAAWRRRHFRDVAEFRAVQIAWVVWAGLAVLFFLAFLIGNAGLQDLVGPACGPVG